MHNFIISNEFWYFLGVLLVWAWISLISQIKTLMDPNIPLPPENTQIKLTPCAITILHILLFFLLIIFTLVDILHVTKNL